jgi:hypothetical protein
MAAAAKNRFTGLQREDIPSPAQERGTTLGERRRAYIRYAVSSSAPASKGRSPSRKEMCAEPCKRSMMP